LTRRYWRVIEKERLEKERLEKERLEKDRLEKDHARLIAGTIP
jgi:hypothetical protein